MNKYLMMSAAAVLASVAGAQAGTPKYSFQFGDANGASYCDGGTVYSSGANIWAWQHTNNDCQGGVSYGQGLVGKNSVTGKSADMSDNIYGSSGLTLNVVLPAKLKTGAPYSIWCQYSGTTSFECNSGTLANVANGAKYRTRRGGRSATAALKTLIQAHRSASQHA